MSKFDNAYSSRWLKAGDLDGGARNLQIEAAEWQEVGSEKEEKLVLAFVGENKLLILNSINANAIAAKLTKVETCWPGNWVEVWAVETPFGPGVRVRPIESPIDVPF